MNPSRTRRSARAVVLLTLVSLVMSMLGGATASAHTGFESSTPADGAVLEAPVDLVTIVFTGQATPVGDEFLALTPQGVVQAPASVETLNDMVFSLRFDPPLAGGEVGLRWNVQAADAHPIEGAFSFVVNAPAPTTSTTTTTTTTTTEPPATSTSTSPSPSSTVPTTEAAAVSTTEAAADTTVGTEAADIAAPPTLDEFLTVDNSRPGDTTATVGRLVGLVGVVLGLGAFAFLATALRGRRDEIDRVLIAIRVLAGAVVIGAAIEYVGVGRIAGDGLGSTWSTAPGFATVMRCLGGVGLMLGVGGTITQSSPARWTRTARSWPALAAVAVILASFWFDGHTVSKGFRPLHALVNTVHVTAGAVWAGGVVTLAAIVWGRFRQQEPLGTAELVVRFSKIATIALAAVIVAGAVMAFLVLDSFGELTGTPWGKVLLLKTAGVGLAAIGGAYNHFRLLPVLDADPESGSALTELRSTITAEAIMLVFVVTVTAWLVAAAS